MNNKSQIKILITLIFLLVFIGVFVFAEVINNNYKTYDESEKVVSIFSQDDILLAEIQLITPIDYLVPRGYQQVAEFKITNAQDSSLLYDQMKFYNVKDSMKEVDRIFDFKFKEDVLVEVDDYGDINISLGKYKTIIEYFGYVNSTTSPKRNLINYSDDSNNLLCQRDKDTNELFGCDYILDDKSVLKIGYGIIGSHFELQEQWFLFDKLKDKENILAGEYTIGIFTDVQKGDKIEWIPTFFGVKIDEWAVWTESLSVDLVSYWKMDESSGNMIDEQENYTGTLQNSPTQDSSGKINSGYEFDGADQYVTFSTLSELNNVNAFSFSMWYNADDTSTDTLISQWTYSSQGTFAIQSSSGEFVSWICGFVTDGGVNFITTSDASMTGWNHVVLVYDGTQGTSKDRLKIYVNGTLPSYSEAGTIPATTTVGTATFSVGRFEGLGRYWDGHIDEIGFWGRALTSTEVSDLYNSGDGIPYGVAGDTQSPYFTNNTPQNQTIAQGFAFAYDINATDETAFDCFAVNDTTNFKINCSGMLENNTKLSLGLYNLNITINDTSNNLNSSYMWVNVTISSYSKNITQQFTTTSTTDRTGSLKKEIPQIFTISSFIDRIGSFFRDFQEIITINILIKRVGNFFRDLSESFSINEIVEKVTTIANRIATDYFQAVVNYVPSFVERIVSFFRNPFQDLNFNTFFERIIGFFRKLFDSFNINTIIEKLRNVIKNIFQLIQMLFSFLSKSSVIAWNWITSVETLTQLPAIESSRVSWELHDTWTADAGSPSNWVDVNKTYNLPTDCADVRIEIDSVNITGYPSLVSNVDCDYAVINNNTLYPANTSLINITYTTTASTSSEGDWIASNKRITQRTNWINTLTLSNPSSHTYGNISINITTDKNSISGAINITNISDNVFPHTFDNSDGNVNWSLSSLDSGDDYIFTTEYKTEKINLTKTNHTETILGKDYEVYNVTITANSSRNILSVYSYFNFSDESIISNKFYKCSNGFTNCTEDISNRVDTVWEDQDSDGSYDYVEWYITTLTQNQSYQLKNDKGFPIEVTTTSEILNKPIYAFDNILWRTTITMYNPNAFSTEKVYKYEFPLGATDIKLDDISKNLQYPAFGGLAPYVTIIDNDDSAHTNSVYLSPGETKTFIVKYRTSSVTINPSTYFPTYFEVGENALINQILRINNQAEDDVTDVEYRIPIDYAEDLIVCLGEFESGCEEDEDVPQYNLTLDTKEEVNGDYTLEIDSIDSGETKYITLSYYTPTAIVKSIEQGRRSVQGNLTTFKKIVLESQARFTLPDLRYREPEIDCEDIIQVSKCRINGVCDIPIGYDCPLKLKVGSLGIGEEVSVMIWYVERPDEEEPTFMDNFVDWFSENIWNGGKKIELSGVWKYIGGFIASEDPTTGELYIPLYRLIFVGSIVGLIIALIIWYRLRKRKKLRRNRDV